MAEACGGISVARRSSYVHIVKSLLGAGADPNAMKFKRYFSAWVMNQKTTKSGVTSYTAFGGAGSKGKIVDADLGDLSALGLAQKEGLTDIIPILVRAGTH